jgi:beta-glucosidase
MKKTSRKKTICLTLAAVGTLILGAAVFQDGSAVNALKVQTAKFGTKDEYLANNGKYYADFEDMTQAKQGAGEVNADICREGNTVLKNDGTLPLAAGSRVSIFGVAQKSPVGVSSGMGGTSSTDDDPNADYPKTPAAALENAGYVVNPVLLSFYSHSSTSSSGGGMGGMGGQSVGAAVAEITDFTHNVINSLGIYDDAAVIYLSRSGGEGADLGTETTEDSVAGEHANEVTGKKHYLELSDSERAMIKTVEAHFSKICVVLNTSHPMEMGILKDDAKINSIIWIGRPGETGFVALGEILKGTVNPSGRLVDVWARDFTKDPTWFNFGNNQQVGLTDSDRYYYPDGSPAGDTSANGGPMASGFYGVDYEEGIYLGYKYYETRYNAIAGATNIATADAWYKNNVVFPFASGLSYTKFSYHIGGLFTDADCTAVLGTTVDPAKFSSSVGHEAAVKSIYVPVTVTNTGSVAGKQTVQIYVTAPYTNGGVEKSFVTLAGYAKSGVLAPNASEVVTVKVNVQDFSSYDYKDLNNDGNKGYELDPGQYIVRAMDSSHVELSGNYGDHPYDETAFTLTGTAPADLKLDDFSGNATKNETSKENGYYDTVREGVNTTDTDPMTILSRADMGHENDADVASFPKAPTTAGRTFTKAFYDEISRLEMYDADNSTQYANGDDKTNAAAERWAIGSDDIPSDWTQAEKTATTNATLLKDMAGVSLTSAEGKAKWTTFMNQLSWEEIARIVGNGGYATADVPSIGKSLGINSDDPLDLSGTFGWCDEPTLSATYNVKLAKKQGQVVGDLGMFKNCEGWYGPGMDTHRTPFSGRNAQYYSQDGIQGGIIAAAVVDGAESRGLICYCKHFACNDQETDRAGDDHFTWITEQALRENQLKVFQMAFQEGGSSACMSACARFGLQSAGSDYNVLTGIVRNEWGWNGYFVTDGYTGDMKSNPVDLMIRAGQDLPLGDSSAQLNKVYYDNATITVFNKETAGATAETTPDTTKVISSRVLSGTWDKTLRSGKGGVKVGGTAMDRYDFTNRAAVNDTPAAVESAAQYYYARMCAMRILFNNANSQDNHNGITMVNDYSGACAYVAWDKSGDLGTVAQGTEITAATKLTVGITDTLLNGATTAYEVTDGELPDGLTLNSDGTITGTPSGKVGTYTFTVTLYADSWNTAKATFTLKVTSAFTWDGDALTGAKVGTDFVGYVKSDTVKSGTTGGTGSSSSGGSTVTVTYGLDDDSVLPAGLAIKSDGEISGTPTKGGTYDFVVKVTSVTSGGWGSSGTTAYYYVDMEIVVTDPNPTVQDQIDTINTKINNGTSATSTAQTTADNATAAATTAQTAASAAQSAADAAQSAADVNAAAIASANQQAQASKTIGTVGIVLGSVGILVAAAALAFVFLKKKPM